MTAIKDSKKSGIQKPRINLETRVSNFKKLNVEDTADHFNMLSDMLVLTSKFILGKFPEYNTASNEIENYLSSLRAALEVFLLKGKIWALKKNSDLPLEMSIDPSDSGFPLYLRDFYLLNNEQVKARANSTPMPSDEQLVDDALFTLFRGVMPEDIVIKKLEKELQETLIHIELVERIHVHRVHFIKQDDGFDFYKTTVERFHEHNNIPIFYTLYFKVPIYYYNHTYVWEQKLDEAIKEGINTLSSYELTNLANVLEAVEGVRLQMINRLDIGPFYNRYTENPELIDFLINQDVEKACIMAVRNYTIHRAGEKTPRGLSEWFRTRVFGDICHGYFTPVLAGPKFFIMPHRLIQKIHHHDLNLEEEIKMYGITDGGDIID